VFDNCVRAVNAQGVYFHVRCTSEVALRKVARCGCGLCAGA